MKNNIATTIEQSKELIKLGLDVSTADMCHCLNYKDSTLEELKYNLLPDPYMTLRTKSDSIPAWSLSALSENIIPQEIEDEEYILNITAGKCYKWIITYDDVEEDWKCAPGLVGLGDTLIDACVELIIKLKERKVI